MAFNFVEADCGTLDEFLDRWHQVRVQLKLDSYTGALWVDGRLVLDGVPLRQSFDVALIPELMMTCGSGKPAGVWVEDIEVKYRDQALEPKNEGEEVSQSIVDDSFETYRAGVFPRTGGWLTGIEKILGSSSEIRPGETPADALSARPAGSLKDKVKRLGKAKTETEAESKGGEALQSGGQGAQALNLSAGASENGAALIDEEDSVSGLRSFRLETVGIGPVSVVKRFSLPSRVPFGVSGGSFAIGVEPSDSQRETGLREGLDRESRLDRRSGKLGKENDPETGPTSGVKSERNFPADSRSADTALDQGSGGSRKTMTTLSASPVGNFYIYSFDGTLLQVYDVYGTCLKDYIYMGGRLIAEYDHVGGRFLYYTPDQINSTRVVTDDSGTVVYSAAHDPYGGIQQTWVNTFDPLPKFSGKERDEESQLDYFGARYYDRAQYRFISVDPMITQSISTDSKRRNLYSYCGNNPVIYLELDGNSYLVFNRSTQELYLISKDFYLVGVYDASNNAAKPWPDGMYSCAGFAAFPDNGPSDSISNSGFWEFNVFGRTEMGIHAGRWGDPDACDPPNFGWEHYTLGCIRTTEMGMGAINELASSGDSPEMLIVGHDDLNLFNQILSAWISRITAAVQSLMLSIGTALGPWI